MRISDWSSDVCSSDLGKPSRLQTDTLAEASASLSAGTSSGMTHGNIARDSSSTWVNRVMLWHSSRPAMVASSVRVASSAQIGRDSCKERILWYMMNWLVDLHVPQ